MTPAAVAAEAGLSRSESLAWAWLVAAATSSRRPVRASASRIARDSGTSAAAAGRALDVLIGLGAVVREAPGIYRVDVLFGIYPPRWNTTDVRLRHTA